MQQECCAQQDARRARKASNELYPQEHETTQKNEIYDIPSSKPKIKY